MKHLLEIIRENGYKPYRCGVIFKNQNASSKEQNKYIIEKYDCIFTKGDKNNGTFYFKPNYSENDFSSMRVGGLATFYVKDKNFDKPIIWGLSEISKPPCLITPKLNINVLSLKNESLSPQTQTELVLQNYDHQFIFDNLFTDYKYEVRKNPDN